MKVVGAYSTDYFYGGQPEVILELENGWAAYLHPDREHKLCRSLAAAQAIAIGRPLESPLLLAATPEWEPGEVSGYKPLPKTAGITFTEGRAIVPYLPRNEDVRRFLLEKYEAANSKAVVQALRDYKQTLEVG